MTTYRNKTRHTHEEVFKAYGLNPRRGPQPRVGNEIAGNRHGDGLEKNYEWCIKQVLNDNNVKEFVC